MRHDSHAGAEKMQPQGARMSERADALAALVAEASRRHTAWLIEAPWSPPHWIAVGGGSFQWTADPNAALRFARKKDGEAALVGIRHCFSRLFAGPSGMPKPFVTEHSWE
jgi:hypothetical protein